MIQKIKNKLKAFKLSEKTLLSTTILFFLPFAIFITLDLFTTYLSVCFSTGFEANPTAIAIASNFGFGAAGLFTYATYFFMSLTLAFVYRSSKTNIYKIFTIVVWTMAVINYSHVIMSNSNNMYHLATGEDLLPNQVVQEVHKEVFMATPEEIEETKQIFIERRKDFCRILP